VNREQTAQSKFGSRFRWLVQRLQQGSGHYRIAMNRLSLFKQTLEACQKRRIQRPNSRPLLSIENQLEYLVALEQGQRSDAELISNLNLGLLAARELEPHDMELANLIYDVTEAVKQMEFDK
jgi:hypothetical protein